jgi:hypothetical protein
VIGKYLAGCQVGPQAPQQNVNDRAGRVVALHSSAEVPYERLAQ